MAGLETKRLRLELVRVRAAKAEMEFNVDEKKEDIERLYNNINIQNKREQELVKLIQTAESKEVN